MPGMVYIPGHPEQQQPGPGAEQPPLYPPTGWTPTPPPPRKSRTGLFVALAAFGLAVLLGAGVGVYYLTRPAPAKVQSPQNRAIADCEAAVKDRLKAPATAQFSEVVVGAGQKDEYIVTGAVDAQNGFGALIRNHFRCDYTYYGGLNRSGTVDVTEG